MSNKSCFQLSVSRLLVQGLAIVMLLGVGAAATAADKEPRQWVPGQPYPPELLDQYPCHSYELECGHLPPPPIEKVEFNEELNGDAERGEKIAINLRWGNCIACHKLPGHETGSGTVGPSLVDYAERGLPHSYTFQRIWDPRVVNPNAHMPVFGPNRILTKNDIVDVMTFLYSKK